MRNLFLFLILLSGFTAAAQNQTIIRRITTQTETIPASDTVTGRVWTDSSNSSYTVLRYVGTTNLLTTFSGSNVGTYGFMWIYMPGAAIPLAKVLSVTKMATDTFYVTVDRALTGVVSQPIKSVFGRVYGYSYQNDGAANGTANGVVIKPGETVTSAMYDIQGTGIYWQEPVLIVGTSTDFLIIEQH